jgi:DNA-binding LacI/PurR family transcriptional regulator
VFSDPFFASVVQGVALELAETDYTLNLLIASEANSEKTRRYLLGGNVDGALVVSHHSGDHSYTRLGRELPIVFGGRPMGADAASSTRAARTSRRSPGGRTCRAGWIASRDGGPN